MYLKNSVNSMVKSVVLSNLIIGIIITLLVFYLFGRYYYSYALGLSVSLVTFFINVLVTKKLLINKNNKNNLKNNKKTDIVYIISGFIMRVVIVCAVAIVLIKQNRYNIIPYISGYSSQFIGLFLGSRKVM